MPSLVNQTENKEPLIFDLVIDEVGKRSTFPARKSVRPDMIATSPVDDDPNHFFDSGMKVVAKTWRDFGVPGFCFKQVALEERTEDDLHAFSPKTSSNDIPASLPDSRSVSRERNIARNSSSVRPSLFKLSINNFASCCRCSGGSESASSAR
jgi:hypothetical protein